MSALALLARGENKFVKLAEHDTVILSSHAIPGNESNVNRVIDGLLRLGAEVVHSGIARRARHRPRPGRRDQDLPVDRQARVVRADPRRVPPHGRQRRASATLMGVAARPGASSARTATCSSSPTAASRWPAACRPATCTSTASSATSAQGVLRDRRVLAERGRRRRRRHRRHADRQGAHRARDHHPRLGVRTRGRGPARRGVRHDRRRRSRRRWRPACATSRRSSATCAGPPASSSTSAPSGAR